MENIFNIAYTFNINIKVSQKYVNIKHQPHSINVLDRKQQH